MKTKITLHRTKIRFTRQLVDKFRCILKHSIDFLVPNKIRLKTRYISYFSSRCSNWNLMSSKLTGRLSTVYYVTTRKSTFPWSWDISARDVDFHESTEKFCSAHTMHIQLPTSFLSHFETKWTLCLTIANLFKATCQKKT